MDIKKDDLTPITYIKKGFWISLGATGGMIVIALGIGSIIVVGLHQRDNLGRLGQFWNELWYNKEQREFIKCWREEYTPYMNTTITDIEKFGIPKTPTEICKARGLKPFFPYNK
jgi:hypothetical protein